ncbi:MAG TPA: prolyl oligopeptidase family serine peptidase [Pirellulales bacterium]|nr:prolyl oligopeptidase family serine peptidase [Pirellulales bacterium]
MRSPLSLLSILLLALPARADGPTDNLPDNVRRIPKLGIEVPADERAKLEDGLNALDAAIRQLATRDDATVRDLLPDVRIYRKAVGDALEYQEFFDPKEWVVAHELLAEGRQRAADLAEGRAPWTTATGLVVRGYVSKIDGSVQPFGLVVPASYSAAGAHRHRLDLWFHGRGETLSELSFIQGRRTQPGQFTPQDTIVLHPYGRYSNAFKFAGEIDVLEALETVRRRYRIDPDRISIRGFSMGGAACWHFAAHYADRWFAANPGAGFSETPEFLDFFQKETLHPTWYERKLWQLYDCPLWAQNLFHCPTVAYSGEDDIQKQAADVMQAALDAVGIDLVHVIGPKTAHSYHPESQATVEQIMDSLAEVGRDRLPTLVQMSTHTLKYNRMHWVTVDGLAEHWKPARVEAVIDDGPSVVIATENVTDLSLEMRPGYSPFDQDQPVEIVIDEEPLDAPQPRSDLSWRVALHRRDGQWQLGPREADGLRKRHDLQGPIDDALMDSFIFVRPTKKPAHEAVGEWAGAELERAIEHWRRHFRGVARVKLDTEIDDDTIASSNLVLWGDPASNAVLSRIADKLPIVWNAKQITAGKRSFPADSHALIAIYPNPLNPRRYVVLNSSFTFREYAYLNNARQVPKLPDWAVVDLRTPPDTLWPGKIVAADFFDEEWRLKPPHQD